MMRFTVDQLAELLAPTVNDPEFREPECAVRYCSREGIICHSNSNGAVRLCREHGDELQKKISQLRGGSRRKRGA